MRYIYATSSLRSYLIPRSVSLHWSEHDLRQRICKYTRQQNKTATESCMKLRSTLAEAIWMCACIFFFKIQRNLISPGRFTWMCTYVFVFEILRVAIYSSSDLLNKKNAKVPWPLQAWAQPLMVESSEIRIWWIVKIAVEAWSMYMSIFFNGKIERRGWRTLAFSLSIRQG